MLDKEIFECCRKLRLSRNLAELAQTTEGSSHQEYLHQLLSDELRYRELTRTQKLVTSAGFYGIHTFEGYRFDEITLPLYLSIKKFSVWSRKVVHLPTQFCSLADGRPISFLTEYHLRNF